jgi:hypothetical protein
VVINRWWEADPAEIFWMEITGRNDLGANLAAPQTDERGAEYVGYTLVREVRDGDVVFHFHRKLRQIVAWSRAVGGPYTGTIIWAAAGRVSASTAAVRPTNDQAGSSTLKAHTPGPRQSAGLSRW